MTATILCPPSQAAAAAAGGGDEDVAANNNKKPRLSEPEVILLPGPPAAEVRCHAPGTLPVCVFLAGSLEAPHSRALTCF